MSLMFERAALDELYPDGWSIREGVLFVDEVKQTNTKKNEKIAEMQAEYDALAWKRSRQAEYPTIAELTVALYDTDDKSAVEAKRAAVKLKYPKPE